MLKLPFFLLLITCFIGGTISASPPRAKKSFRAYTQLDRLTIWQEIGFTDADCESLNQEEFDSFSPAKQAFITAKRKQAEKACKYRKVLDVNPGDTVDVRTAEGGQNDRSIAVTTTVQYKGNNEKRQFVLGKLHNRPELEGWISREQISAIEERNILFDLANPCPECDGLKRTTTGLPEQTKEIKIAEQAIDILNLTSPSEIKIKNQSEIDRFVCLHRAPYGVVNDTQEFLASGYGKFKAAAEQAEKAFGVPKQLLLCGILAESNYKPGQESDAGALGYAQIMPRTMETISKLPQVRPEFGEKSYQEMWNTYLASPATKGSALTNDKVRMEDHISSSVGAMAIYFRFLFDSQLKPVTQSGKCKDCRGDFNNMTRKDLYLLLTGYNGGPAYILRVRDKSPAQLRRTNPPPPETNKYIEKIENCLEEGKETSFSETPSELAKISAQREKDIKQLEKEIENIEKAYKYNLEIFESRQTRIEARKNAEAAKKLDPNVKLPAIVTPYPKPSDPTEKIANRRERIAFLKELNKIEANASFGNRLDMCKASMPPVAKSDGKK